MHITINSQYNYHSSHKGLPQQCHKQHNVTVTVAATAVSCHKSRQQNVLPSVTYSPTHRQTGATPLNIRSTLRTAQICVEMFHCGVIW